MPCLATMLTISTYGTWLRGDARGWIDDGIVFPPDPQLQMKDRKRLKHPPFYFARDIRHRIGHAMGVSLSTRLDLSILAMCVQSWHAHIVVGQNFHPIPDIVKCAKDAVRWELRLGRPIWATDYDKRYCWDERSVFARINYVERHNIEDGLARRPWEFIVSYESRE